MLLGSGSGAQSAASRSWPMAPGAPARPSEAASSRVRASKHTAHRTLLVYPAPMSGQLRWTCVCESVARAQSGTLQVQ